MTLKLTAYNDSIEAYIEDTFKEFQNFQVDEAFFKELCERKMRSYKNSMTQEPYKRLMMVQSEVLYGSLTTLESMEILKEITFEKFLKFKD